MKSTDPVLNEVKPVLRQLQSRIRLFRPSPGLEERGLRLVV